MAPQIVKMFSCMIQDTRLVDYNFSSWRSNDFSEYCGLLNICHGNRVDRFDMKLYLFSEYAANLAMNCSSLIRYFQLL